MRILLTKISDERHSLEIVRDDHEREKIELVTREFLFHDLLHYAVEAAIGTPHGFWGALASGKTMAEINDRSGAPMEEYGGAMAAVEQAVGMMTGVIKDAAPAAQAIETLRGYHEALGQQMPAWLTEQFITDVRERMRQLLGRWKATPYRQMMEIVWPS